MELERGRIVEIVVSTGVVSLFAVLIVWIGLIYNQGGMDHDGGLALVGSIALFVVVMAGMGFALAYFLNRE